MVFGFHAWTFGIGFSDLYAWVDRIGKAPFETASKIIGNFGIQGVALFYVISAFLLYRPFVKARINGAAGPNLRAYGVRRVARIFPAYWLALIIIGSLNGDAAKLFSPHGLVTWFLLGHIYSMSEIYSNPVPTSWTIAVELSFYIFLPLWSLAVARFTAKNGFSLRRELIALAALAAFGTLWQLVAVQQVTLHNHFQPLLVVLPASLNVFAAGMALAVLSLHAEIERAGKVAQLLRGCAPFSWPAAVVTYLLLCFVASPDDPLGLGWQAQTLAVDWLKIPAAIALVLPVVTGALMGGETSRSRPLRLLTGRVLASMGVVSYGIYLWQIYVMKTLFHGDIVLLPTPSLLMFIPASLLALGVTALIAAASWFSVEKRAIEAAHRVS
jgi:peptidoglycan/LPS O-acetylase OafA/YrhL